MKQVKVLSNQQILERLQGGLDSLSFFIGIRITRVIVTLDDIQLFDRDNKLISFETEIDQLDLSI